MYVYIYIYIYTHDTHTHTYKIKPHTQASVLQGPLLGGKLPAGRPRYPSRVGL